METCNLKNGFLVAPKSVDELFQAIEKFSKLTISQKNNMRLESYRMFTERYDSTIIFSQILIEVQKNYPTLRKTFFKNTFVLNDANSDIDFPTIKKQLI
jgi:hypothetical protein